MDRFGNLSRKTEIRLGLQDSLSAGLGVFPLGIALGMLVVQAQLPWWAVPLLSTFVYAGSVELFLVTLITAHTSLLTIAITVFAVNFRHVFYAFSFPLHRVTPGLLRGYSVFALNDESFATYATKAPDSLSSTRILTMQSVTHLYWVAGGLVGVVIAESLPRPVEGFEFALTALFTAMFIDALRTRKQIPSFLLAAASITFAFLVAPENAILVSLLIFGALLAVRFFTTGDTDAPADNTELPGTETKGQQS